ncbi:protein FAR-RED ELONGATED HYPOCOTYL 1-like [Salvia divinorum]|uniref:Protein FAR-RED ELONGATED HYPOCOTYL 1-like n=1 Tax=Salvia divinorum TaxID=28513 RepID=A0ABD1H2J2_SALDI
MEANMITPDEIYSIDYLNKKRKLQDELLVMPLSKHACWDHRLVSEFPSDSTMNLKMVRGNISARGVESGPDSASNSYCFPSDTDMSMTSHDDAKTYFSFPIAHASAKSGASSSFSDDKSSQIGLYSSENRSLTKENSGKFESPSICEDLKCLYHKYSLDLSHNYGVHLLECGSQADCIFSEYQNEVIEGCVDEGIDNQLYSNEATDSNFVLSSGRWSVNQDSHKGTRKPTIDKEFEQYFSALML